MPRIIEAGSSREYLQSLALDIYDLCLCYDIDLFPRWVPREDNSVADKISKLCDNDNWSIDNDTFNFIQQQFGNFTIDRFADNLNKKLMRVNSKFYCPGPEDVNAFTCQWGGEYNWLCPPISLISRTLRHLRYYCSATGVSLIGDLHIFGRY